MNQKKSNKVQQDKSSKNVKQTKMTRNLSLRKNPAGGPVQGPKIQGVRLTNHNETLVEEY